MINPASIMKIMNAKNKFTANHPKFAAFLNAVFSTGITEGTIIEITVTKPGEEPITTNMKVQQSDSPVIEERYLALCAGRAVFNGLSEFDALKAITINAAKHIGIEDRVGSIEAGKDADFVLTGENPFAVDTHILYTIIDGNVVYEGGEA